MNTSKKWLKIAEAFISDDQTEEQYNIANDGLCNAIEEVFPWSGDYTDICKEKNKAYDVLEALAPENQYCCYWYPIDQFCDPTTKANNIHRCQFALLISELDKEDYDAIAKIGAEIYLNKEKIEISRIFGYHG